MSGFARRNLNLDFLKKERRGKKKGRCGALYRRQSRIARYSLKIPGINNFFTGRKKEAIVPPGGCHAAIPVLKSGGESS